MQFLFLCESYEGFLDVLCSVDELQEAGAGLPGEARAGVVGVGVVGAGHGAEGEPFTGVGRGHRLVVVGGGGGRCGGG